MKKILEEKRKEGRQKRFYNFLDYIFFLKLSEKNILSSPFFLLTPISFHFHPLPKPDADKADLVVVNEQEAVVISALYFPHHCQKIRNVIVKQTGIFLEHVLVNGAVAEWEYENGVHVCSDGFAYGADVLRQNKEVTVFVPVSDGEFNKFFALLVKLAADHGAVHRVVKNEGVDVGMVEIERLEIDAVKKGAAL